MAYTPKFKLGPAPSPVITLFQGGRPVVTENPQFNIWTTRLQSWLDDLANAVEVRETPVNTALPVISGIARVDQTLSVNDGVWSATPDPTYTYQWQHTTTNIAGATNSTYVVEAAYIGETLRCKVTATNSGGATTATTANTIAVTAFVPFSQDFPTAGGYLLPIPAGAALLTASCVGAGSVNYAGDGGGGGGAAAQKTNHSVTGLSAVYVVVGDYNRAAGAAGSTFVRENNSVGTVICLAVGGSSKTGGAAASCTGTTKYSGGNGGADTATGPPYEGGGGGAAGPTTGDGGNGSSVAPYTGGTSPHPGAGGSGVGGAGENWGGGAAGSGTVAGVGYVQLVWA